MQKSLEDSIVVGEEAKWQWDGMKDGKKSGCVKVNVEHPYMSFSLVREVTERE